MSSYKYPMYIRKENLYFIIRVQIDPSYLLCCLCPLHPYLFSILFTFLRLGILCLSLLIFVCFCLLVLPVVSTLRRWLMYRKYLFHCCCWCGLCLYKVFFVLFISFYPESYLVKITVLLLFCLPLRGMLCTTLYSQILCVTLF